MQTGLSWNMKMHVHKETNYFVIKYHDYKKQELIPIKSPVFLMSTPMQG